MSVPRRIWILRLVPDVRFGRVFTAVAVLLILLGAYAAVGMFGGNSSNTGAPTAALFFAVIIAYVVPTFHYTVARCEDAFADLAPRLNATARQIDGWRHSIGQRSVRAQSIILVIGVAAGVAHNVALTRANGLVQAFTGNRIDAAVAWGTMLVWIVMMTVVAGLFQIALVFSRLGRRTRVDLLQPRTLTPFARVAVILTLAIIGAQAAFPILWLNSQLSAIASIPGLITTTIPMLFLFAMPLMPIHRAIAATKAAEIERLDGQLAALTEAKQKDSELLARLAPLLAYRREIESVREWPFDTGVSSRLAFYLVIPPITWIGSAVIQHFVDSAL